MGFTHTKNNFFYMKQKRVNYLEESKNGHLICPICGKEIRIEEDSYSGPLLKNENYKKKIEKFFISLSTQKNIDKIDSFFHFNKYLYAPQEGFYEFLWRVEDELFLSVIDIDKFLFLKICKQHFACVSKYLEIYVARYGEIQEFLEYRDKENNNFYSDDLRL